MQNAMLRLKLEWLNADADEMRPVREALGQLRATESYEENVIRIALHEEDRQSDSPRFLARLLYMVADRPVSVSQMQAVTGLHAGHLYRFLERGGVEYSAATVRKLEVEESCKPWKDNVYLDPLQGVICRRGEITPIDLTVIPSEDRRTLDVLLPEDDAVDLAPLPPMNLPAIPALLLRAKPNK